MSKDPLIGKTLGDFRVVEVIESGPVGVLYRAKELSKDRTVALRVIAPELAKKSGFKKRFLNEMEQLSGAYHPNVLTVYTAGESEAGGLYVAMRHHPSLTLRRVVSQAGPLHVPETTELLAQVAAGLAFAHERGVIHRGISPDTIHLWADQDREEVTVTDFGITEDSGRFGGIKGMPDDGSRPMLDYASPEQASGKPADPRSDLYSLGCVIFEALTGSPPFAGIRDRDKAEAHKNKTPPAIKVEGTEVPAKLAEVVGRLLAKAPGDRFASAEALLRAVPEPALAAVSAGSVPATGGALHGRLLAIGGESEIASSGDVPDAGEGEATGGKGGAGGGRDKERKRSKVKIAARKGPKSKQGEAAKAAAADEPGAEPEQAEPEDVGKPKEGERAGHGWKRRHRGIAVGAVATLVAATAGVLALSGVFDDETEPARDGGTAQQGSPGGEDGGSAPAGERGGEPGTDGSQPQGAGRAGASPSLVEWPEGTGAYTAVAFASPSDLAEARDRARKAAELGLRAGVLDSSDYPSLVSGVWVAFAGIYDSPGEAAEAAERLRSAGVAAAPYVRFVGQSP